MMRAWLLPLLLLAGVSLQAQATCVTCHAGQTVGLSKTPHATLHDDSDPAQSCISCHGEGSEHLASPSSGGVLKFSSEPAREKNANCTGCHSDVHVSKTSVHERAGVACSDCHAIHAELEPSPAPQGSEDLDDGSAICVGCHEDVLAMFSFNKRHRLLENSVTCVSCHDPHASSERLQLGAFKHARCLSCHADKEGPFVFEHAASRVDGCVACHVPHGSANRHLLKHQEVGAQCYGCHAEVVQFHLGFSPVGAPRFGVDTVCTNCHVTIHGSNFDRLFLK